MAVRFGEVIVLQPSSKACDLAELLQKTVCSGLTMPEASYLQVEDRTPKEIEAHFTVVSEAFHLSHGEEVHRAVLDLGPQLNAARSIAACRRNFEPPSQCRNPHPESGKPIPESIVRLQRDCVDLSYWQGQVQDFRPKLTLGTDWINCLKKFYFVSDLSFSEEALITPMRFSENCPLCKEEIEVVLHRIGGLVCFICAACGHTEKPGQCPCSGCQKVRSIQVSALSDSIKNLRDCLIGVFNEQLTALYAAEPEEVPLIEMQRDYKLLNTAAMVSPLAREIFDLGPINEQDLLNCIQRVAEARAKRKYTHHYDPTHYTVRNDIDKVVSQAKKHFLETGVLHECSRPEPVENIETEALLLAEKAIGNFLNLPVSLARFFVILNDATNVTVEVLSGSDRQYYEFVGFGTIQGKEVWTRAQISCNSKVPIAERLAVGVTKEKYLVVNPYYLSSSTDMESPAGASAPQMSRSPYAKRVYKSNAENCRHAMLRAKYPDLHISPNVRLVDMVDLEGLSSSKYEKTDLRYLRNCVIDFSVWDHEGFLLFVEELQRGAHHENAEWRRKDKLKRRALTDLGVRIVESF